MRGRFVLGAALALSLAAGAVSAKEKHDHDHGHDHAVAAHDHQHDDISKGYFDDAQIGDRALSDWEGHWQSVYPLLQQGALDPVMAHKAETGTQTAAEHRAAYEIGYKTDVDRIDIHGDEVSFQANGTTLTARYAADGRETLTYAKGNRGVRFIFVKISGDAYAPGFIQFSDHRIAAEKSDHYHLYWGNDRAALLAEVTNWPTYYPAGMGADEIVHEMLAH